MIYHKMMKEGEQLVEVTQDEVRKRLIEKTRAVRQQNIAAATGIPREIISKFMNNKRDLYSNSLHVLNDYLNKH